MTDREMLELAAKAEGHVCDWFWSDNGRNGAGMYRMQKNTLSFFNPLQDDGDALRLAVKLAIPFHVFYEGGSVVAYGKKTKHHPEGLDIQELFTSDPCKATRRAITRAAAQIQLDKETA